MNTPPLVACHVLPTAATDVHTLAIDVGGSGLKAAVLDPAGAMASERVRVVTPTGAPPETVVALLADLVRDLPPFDRVGVGFPGRVRDGVVRTAPNLGHDGWRGFDLAAALQTTFGKPVRVANDADVQGLAVIEGRGVELVITLGTGFGTGLYEDGRLCPHLEISHQPFRHGETYDEQLGARALAAVGKRKWRRRVHRSIDNLRDLVGFDRLYVGGGNAKRLGDDLPDDVTVVDNRAGLLGAVRLFDAGR